MTDTFDTAPAGHGPVPSVAPSVTPSAARSDWLKVWGIGLSGLTPFAVCLAGVLLAGPDWDQRFLAAMVVYGALVATFSAGVRWGAEIVRAMPGPPDPARLARSAPPLVAGLAAVLLLDVSSMAAVGLIIVTGLGLLVWDLMAVRAKLLPGWMAAFRIVAATGAIALMLATAWSATGGTIDNVQTVPPTAAVQSSPVVDPVLPEAR
jgi:hypothetical protein